MIIKCFFVFFVQTIKLALDTRKSNVEAINNLLTEIKVEDELTDGQFPADVGEKVLRLNTDWQIIIELSISLKQTELREEVKEEYIITENLQMEESHEFNFLGKYYLHETIHFCRGANRFANSVKDSWEFGIFFRILGL